MSSIAERMIYRVRILDGTDIEDFIRSMKTLLPASLMDTADQQGATMVVSVREIRDGKVFNVIYEEEIRSRPHARAFPDRLKPLLQAVYLPRARCDGKWLEVKILLR